MKCSVKIFDKITVLQAHSFKISFKSYNMIVTVDDSYRKFYLSIDTQWRRTHWHVKRSLHFLNEWMV